MYDLAKEIEKEWRITYTYRRSDSSSIVILKFPITVEDSRENIRMTLMDKIQLCGCEGRILLDLQPILQCELEQEEKERKNPLIGSAKPNEACK